MSLAACRLDCRLVGAVLEENNSFLKTSENFCSSEFPCFSALYEYSFWSWHDEGCLIRSRLNQRQKQYYHINCLFAFFPDEWHLLTDRSTAKQSSQDEYAWWHAQPHGHPVRWRKPVEADPAPCWRTAFPFLLPCQNIRRGWHHAIETNGVSTFILTGGVAVSEGLFPWGDEKSRR